MIFTSILIFIITVILVSYFIKKIIYVSHEKHLFDEPSEDRKIHLMKTPNLGGAAIFLSMIFTSCMFVSFVTIPHLNYIFFASLILFIIGLTDDLVGIDPLKKMIAQIVIALLITLFTQFRITGFYGLFGIYEIPFAISIILSTLLIIYLVNAFNLIDGINCLAGSIGCLASLAFAFYFWKMGDKGFMLISVAMCGSLASFLYYNQTPARIFMGDTGSLFLGFMMAILSIRFMELNNLNIAKTGSPVFQSAPAIISGLLIVPIYDTLRVFIARIFKGKSPFKADRNHIHHRLIDLGLTHLQATTILLVVTISSVSLVFLLHNFSLEIIFVTLFCFALILNWILYKSDVKKPKEIAPIRNSFSKPKLKIVYEEMNVSNI